MNERILTNKNHGMRALVLWILAFVASIFLCVIGSSLVDTFGGSHVEGAWGYSFWCWGSCGSASAGFSYAA